MEHAILVILCGLPGSGKSYLSRLIEDKVINNRIIIAKGKIECLVVCYDDWLPTVTLDQFSENAPKFTDSSEWKQSRKAIRQTVEQLIVKFRGHPSADPGCQNIKLFQHIQKKFRNGDALQDTNVIFIIDDNMHLKSMRFEYFQLARKYNIGYCQIYMECEPSVAQIRNSSRLARVPDSVIYAMAERFEAPQPQKNSWESLTLVIGADEDCFKSSWSGLERVLKDAFDNPITPLEDNESEKLVSRKMCSMSVLHQADQALRKLLSEAMQKHAGKSSGKDPKQLSLQLNAARQHILTGIKTGEICIPSDILVEVELGDVLNTLPKLKMFFKEKIDRWL